MSYQTLNQTFNNHWYFAFKNPKHLAKVGDIIEVYGDSYWVTKLVDTVKANGQITYNFRLEKVGS